jgi:hypothetical protein
MKNFVKRKFEANIRQILLNSNKKIAIVGYVKMKIGKISPGQVRVLINPLFMGG